MPPPSRRWAMKACSAVVCDSTNALVQGHSGSEADVKIALTDLIGTLKGRVAVTGFASNVARLDTIAKAAKAHGRQVALVAARCTASPAPRAKTGYLTDFPQLIGEEEAAHLPPSKILYLCTGSQGERARRWRALRPAIIPMSASAPATA